MCIDNYTVFQKQRDRVFDDKFNLLELSVYNNFWQTYYQECRPSADVFIFPPHLFCAPALPWETVKA